MKENRVDPLDIQVGGNHYKTSYQPLELMEKVNMNASCAFIAKYVFRHKDKKGKEDLQKALHCCDLLEELGNNWYGYRRTFWDILLGRHKDCDLFDFFKDFITQNPQLDDNQQKAFFAIYNKDMESLKKHIYAEIKECYK